MSFLWVALGGAIGAMCRYAISLIPVKTTFPVLTLITNIMGAILIEFIVGVALNKENMSPSLILFLKTGVCGGFTTFSTFSLEFYNMLEHKEYVQGTTYAALSVLLCIAGVWCGRSLAIMIHR
ncbi:fluoride efflux transporter CrcB [Porcincola intestinalis]|uniref:Fluoride-specific ion channel FluC n=1 Tax=Porcincola intestinalis TaxID=2606632 RepID=A0A6L5X8S4_9FIRM|nr:fluoride efflux transporter CrcB [Porcincola intestinalis]MSS16007.1 fluoride efflux transporter CrcB [Porcincola intestinalis]